MGLIEVISALHCVSLIGCITQVAAVSDIQGDGSPAAAGGNVIADSTFGQGHMLKKSISILEATIKEVTERNNELNKQLMYILVEKALALQSRETCEKEKHAVRSGLQEIADSLSHNNCQSGIICNDISNKQSHELLRFITLSLERQKTVMDTLTQKNKEAEIAKEKAESDLLVATNGESIAKELAKNATETATRAKNDLAESQIALDECEQIKNETKTKYEFLDQVNNDNQRKIEDFEFYQKQLSLNLTEAQSVLEETKSALNESEEAKSEAIKNQNNAETKLVDVKIEAGLLKKENEVLNELCSSASKVMADNSENIRNITSLLIENSNHLETINKSLAVNSVEFLSLNSKLTNNSGKIDDISNTMCFKIPLKASSLNLVKLGERTYFFSHGNTDKRNWDNAQSFCRQHGMELASIESAGEQQLVAAKWAELIKLHGIADMWLGGRRTAPESDLIWSGTGNKMSYVTWYPGYPLSRSDYNCIFMIQYSPHSWGNYPCHFVWPFLCEV